MEHICTALWKNQSSIDDVLIKLIRENKNILNNKNQRGQTPLYIAFRTANVDAVILLKNNGAKITELNTDGSSPVMGFLWNYNKNDIQHKIFFTTFESSIINSRDRRLVKRNHGSAYSQPSIDYNKLLYVENKNGDNNSTLHDGYAKKYPDISFKLIGAYNDIDQKSQGYYLYNDTNSMIQCYELCNNKLSYKFQSKFILNKIGKNIFADILDIYSDYKIRNIPKVYISNGIASDIENEVNANHYFMLPSQLNGAEYPSHDIIISNLNDYMSDYTAGPAGQLAVHASIGQFIIDNAMNSNNPAGINAVKYILGNEPNGNKIKLINGYLKVPQYYQHAHIIKRLIKDLMIICVENIPVDGWNQLKNVSINKNHMVNIIYASAIPINTYVNNYINDDLIDIANTILIGEYFGALQLAYHKGVRIGIKQVIHLSLLGGGVFNNSKDNISNSIIKAIFALEKLYSDVSDYLEIRLQIYKSVKNAEWYDDKFNL